MAFNNKFNLKRFGLLIKQDWIIYKKVYVVNLIMLGLFYFFKICWDFQNGKELFVQHNYGASSIYTDFHQWLSTSIIVMPFVTTCILFGNKNTLSYYLLAPGSSLEKLLVSFFIRVVLLTTIALGLFVLMVNANLALLSSEKINNTTYFDASLMPRFQFQYLLTNKHCDLWNWFAVLNIYSWATIWMAFAFFPRIKTRKGVIRLLLAIAFFVGIIATIEEFNISIPLPKVYAVTTHFTNLAIFGLAIIPTTAFTTFLMAYYFLKEREVK